MYQRPLSLARERSLSGTLYSLYIRKVQLFVWESDFFFLFSWPSCQLKVKASDRSCVSSSGPLHSFFFGWVSLCFKRSLVILPFYYSRYLSTFHRSMLQCPAICFCPESKMRTKETQKRRKRKQNEKESAIASRLCLRMYIMWNY